MIKDWKEIIKNDTRYKDFTILDSPAKFCELFKNKDISIVQLYDTTTYISNGESGIIGFCGYFRWKNNNIISLDGDSYTENTEILGYEWFEDDEGRHCLNVLVGAW